ncbi:MurR/RpiR family transcriptional regulator [Pseudoflavonifractor sp. AF19-9AC]|uniref:MurR/RpiR family transcriptional regulator n=1 Tax=Pseudoflavonifractor sp. AF19-9AC TaxID=2292244 RepID=UPI000E466B7B|nr:MurR/RpiR family transcriptional regulator [Pseudoflavonifractor sp. AF19-9AC]RHR10280.1 MurR/RpiR family transcriptional regulator [Pseudoflavonifractor sp. AF19-9AC]
MEHSSCKKRIAAKYESDSATNTERKIALYMKNNFDRVLHCTLLELAELIGVSDASVVRFCKSIGYSGFQEFKISAALETIPSSEQYHPKLHKDDSPAEICQKIFSTEITALQRTMHALDLENMTKVARILAQAPRIVFAGTGGSMIVARDAQHKFLKIGIHVCAVEDKDIQLMETSLLHKGDVLFAVSHSGNNIHVLRAAELAKSCGATVVGLTSDGKTSLSKIADYSITTISEETIFRSESGSTRLAQLAVIDSLVAIVAFQDYDNAFDAIYKTRAATSDNKV